MNGLIPVYAWIVQTIEEADMILMNGGKLIIISESIPDYLNSPQYGTSCIRANEILPDYRAVSAYIDGDKQAFTAQHFAMMDSPACTVYFATIMAAIVNSIPLGIIFGNEQIEIDSMDNILNYFSARFGIVFGHLSPFRGESPKEIGWMYPQYVGVNVEFLYLNGLITPYELFAVYPPTTPLTPATITKLMADMQPVVSNPTDFNCYRDYFEQLRRTALEKNRPIVDPLMR